jgi:Fuc2NAc and GlcNAc transferase
MDRLLAGVAVAGFAASWGLTGLARRYALRRSLLDVPNHRSSHTAPTPRGGGMAIVAVALAGVGALAVLRVVDGRTAAALAGSLALVAAIGWADDHGGVPARWRALVHAAAAAWALAWLGGMPSLAIGTGPPLRLGAVGTGLALLGIVWLTNLFNFMDGIDGIAGGEAVSVGLGGALLLALHGDHALAAVSLLVAAASAGFLAWNWQPARIFMGDVGSGALGCVLAVLAVASENRGSVPLLAWVLLGGVFIFDATLTLLRRVARGERFFEAHRRHAYQRRVQAGWSHGRTSACVLALNAGLLGLALWATRAPGRLPLAAAAAAALLGAAYLWVERARPMWR